MTRIKTVMQGIRQNQDKLLSYVIFMPLFFLAMQFTILTTFNWFQSPIQPYLRYVVILLTGLAFAIALPTVLRRVSHTVFSTYIIALLLMTFTYYAYPQNRPYLIDGAFNLLGISLPLLVYTLAVRDDIELMNAARKIGNFIALLLGILTVVNLWGTFDGDPYSMALSYYLLFSCIVLLRELFNRASLTKLLGLLLLVLLIILKGSRGSLASMFFFTIAMTCSPHTKLDNRNFLNYAKKGVLLSSLCLMLVFNQQIFGAIGEFAKAINVYSRTAVIAGGDAKVRPEDKLVADEKVEQSATLSMEEMTLAPPAAGRPPTATQFIELPPAEPSEQSTILHLAGRGTMYRAVWDVVRSAGIWPTGLYADRVVLDGRYVHNIALEVLVHFGLVIGPVLLLLFAFITIKSLIRADKLQFELLLMWLSMGLVPLVVSASYLHHMHFWILMGLVFRISGKKRFNIKQVLNYDT